jgi:RNA recognition motif-containing protein
MLVRINLIIQMANSSTYTVDKEKSLYPSNSFCLHMSGLPSETTEDDIFLFFKDYNVKSAKIVK